MCPTIFALTHKILSDAEEIFLQQKFHRRVLYSVAVENIQTFVFSVLQCIAGHSVQDIVNVIIFTTLNILLKNYVSKSE